MIATDLDAGKLKGLARAQKLRARCALDRSRRGAGTRWWSRISAAPTFWSIAPASCITARVLECSESDWDFSFDLNVKSMHRTIRAFLPAMLKKKRGSIVNISSAASSITGLPNRYVYGATKAAVIGLTKAVAADFIRQGIRCNAICPGTIESPSLEGRIDTLAANHRPLAQGHAAGLRRPSADGPARAPPQEVAALAVFLASDESSYITGQPHLVDGGLAL